MAVVDELVTILGLEISPGAMDALKKFQGGINNVKNTLTAFSVAITGAATAAGFFIKSVVDEASDLNTLSQKTGISTTALQEWSYAAKKVGVDAKSIHNDLISLQKSMSSPIPGQYNMTLAMLGVSARKASGGLKTADEVLEDVAEKVKVMSTQRAAQWAAKVGISDDTLLLLRQGKDGIEALRKEAHKLGGIIPEDSVKLASQFKASVTELQFAWRGLTTQAAIATLPVLSKIVELFKDFIAQNREWLSLGLEATMTGLVQGFERFFSLLSQAAGIFDPFIATIKDILPEMDAIEFVTHLVTGALSGLLLIFSPFIAKALLIAGAITAVSLAFEDLFTYIEGGDSVIGHFFDSFEKRFPNIFNALKKFGAFIKDMIISRLETAQGYIEHVGEAFEGLATLIMDNLERIAKPISEFFSTFDKEFPALSKLLESFSKLVSNTLVKAFDLLVAAIEGVIKIIFKALDLVGKAVNKLAGFANWVAEKIGFEEAEGPQGPQGPEKTDKEKIQAWATDAYKAYEGADAALGRQEPTIKQWGEYNIEDYGYSYNTDKTNQKSVIETSPAPAVVQTKDNSFANSTRQYNDNRQVSIQVATSDALQAAQAIFEKFNDANINSPGQYGFNGE